MGTKGSVRILAGRRSIGAATAENWSLLKKELKMELPYDPPHAHSGTERNNSQSHLYVECKKTKLTEAESRMSVTKSWGW